MRDKRKSGILTNRYCRKGNMVLTENSGYIQSVCMSMITRAVVLGSSMPSEGQSYGWA